MGLILEGRFGLARVVARGRLTEEQAAHARSRLFGTTSYEEGLAGAEAIRRVELGVAGPGEVDEMVKTGLGWPMGVFELLDASSFESFYHAQEYLHETCGERYAVPLLARQAYRAGYLGSPDLKPASLGGWYEFLGVDRAEDTS